MQTSNSEPRSIVFQPDDRSISVAQAIYHHVTSKTERIVEAVEGAFTVTTEDIKQLHHKISQTAQRHHQGEWSCEVSVALHKKERINCTSFERFTMLDSGIADATSELVYRYDFLSLNNIIPAGSEVKPERYRVSVLISQDHLAEDEEEQPYYLLQLFSKRNLHVNVEYVDYTIARALMSAIREWIDALPRRKQSKVVIAFSKGADTVRIVIPKVVGAAAIIGSYEFFIGSAGALTIRQIAERGYYAAAGALCLYAFAEFATEGFLKALYFTRQKTYLLVTAGDRNKMSDNETKRLTQKTRARFFAITIILALLINLTSSWIYEHLFNN
jgi:AcrR family transcriptional regulator